MQFAEDGAQAVAAVQKAPFDLVLLDVQMPVMDGLTAAREICRLFPQADKRPKLIAVTADTLPGDREKCMAAGMDGYLSKPVSGKDLETCIEELFSTPAKDAAGPESVDGQESTPEAVPAPSGHVAYAAPDTPPPSPTPAPEAELASALNLPHIRSLQEGMTPPAAVESLRQLHASVDADFTQTALRLDEICANKDLPQFIQTVHGLKGCFLMLGFAGVGGRCAEALAHARQGTFTDWQSFPGDLRKRYQENSRQMAAYVDGLEENVIEIQSANTRARTITPSQ